MLGPQQNLNPDRTALVLGATGGIGGKVARLLAARGWTVRAMNRDPERLAAARKPAGLIWHKGDAMSGADVGAAAEGVSVIVHAVNPAGYRDWGELALPMLNNTLSAAHANGARIVLPGTIYNFGPDAFPLLNEVSPQNPITVKGRIRAEMERRLRACATQGTTVLIVRAGDFFGPQAANSWFSQAMVKPGKPVRRVTYPGRAGTGHQWAYVPDVAETMVRLVEKPASLAAFAVFHMAGHWDPDGATMIDAIRAATGNARLKVGHVPWRTMRLLAPVVPLFREMLELRYLWEIPVRMDNAHLRSVLGSEPHTPLTEAIRTTLIGLDCIAEAIS